MALPHFSSIPGLGGDGVPGSNVRPQEPVYLGLFEILFVLPSGLLGQNRDVPLLTFQATNISLDLTKDVGVAEQKFKFVKRKFLTFVDDTSASFTIKFNVNVTSDYNMEVWNTLKAWYDLVWNSQTGYTHYKSDIIGTVVVNQHDKKGVVLRRVTFRNVQLKGVTGFELSFGATEIADVTANFEADYWDDEYYDSVAQPSGAPQPGAPTTLAGYSGYQAFGQP